MLHINAPYRHVTLCEEALKGYFYKPRLEVQVNYSHVMAVTTSCFLALTATESG